MTTPKVYSPYPSKPTLPADQDMATEKAKLDQSIGGVTAGQAAVLYQLNNLVKASSNNQPQLTQPDADSFKITAATIAKGLEDIRNTRATPQAKSGAQAGATKAQTDGVETPDETANSLTVALDILLADPIAIQLMDDKADPSWFYDALNNKDNPEYGAVKTFLAKLDEVINQLFVATYNQYMQMPNVKLAAESDDDTGAGAGKAGAINNQSTASDTDYYDYFSSLRDLLRLLVKMKALQREASTELRNLQAQTQLEAATEAKEIMYTAAESAFATGIAGASVTGAITIGSAAFSITSTVKQASANTANLQLTKTEAQSRELNYKIEKTDKQLANHEQAIPKIDEKITANQKALDNAKKSSADEAALKEQQTKLQAERDALAQEKAAIANNNNAVTDREKAVQEIDDKIAANQKALDNVDKKIQDEAAIKEQHTKLQTEKEALIKEKEEHKEAYTKLKEEQKLRKQARLNLDAEREELALKKLKAERIAGLAHTTADVLNGISNAVRQGVEGYSSSLQMAARAEAEYLNALVSAYGLAINSAEEVHKSGGDELRQVLDTLAQIDNRDSDAKANIANRIAH